MRKGYFTLLSVHLAILVIYNVAGCMVASKLQIPSGLSHLLHLPLLKWPSLVTGIATGYGFFAPRAGSPLLLQFRLYDPQGKFLQTVRNPGIISSNGLLRYTSFLHRFQYLSPSAEEEASPLPRQQVLKTTAMDIARYVAKHYPSQVKQVNLQLLAYQPPPLRKNTRHASGYTLVFYEEDVAIYPDLP